MKVTIWALWIVPVRSIQTRQDERRHGSQVHTKGGIAVFVNDRGRSFYRANRTKGRTIAGPAMHGRVRQM